MPLTDVQEACKRKLYKFLVQETCIKFLRIQIQETNTETQTEKRTYINST